MTLPLGRLHAEVLPLMREPHRTIRVVARTNRRPLCRRTRRGELFIRERGREGGAALLLARGVSLLRGAALRRAGGAQPARP